MSAHYFAGIGCRRGVSAASLYELVTSALHEHGIAPDRLAAIASVDSKRDEPALRELADRLDASLLFFSADHLQRYADRVSAASAMVIDTAGANVAESAALAAAESLSAGRAALIIPKCKNADATFALAITTDIAT